MNKLKNIVVYGIVIIFSVIVSCDSLLCGELEKDWKERFEIVENRYSKKFALENIRCESFYLNVHMKVDEVDTSSIEKAHKILYDEESNVGWMSLHVFNPKGEFLFTHSYDGEISTVKPSW